MAAAEDKAESGQGWGDLCAPQKQQWGVLHNFCFIEILKYHTNLLSYVGRLCFWKFAVWLEMCVLQRQYFPLSCSSPLVTWLRLFIHILQVVHRHSALLSAENQYLGLIFVGEKKKIIWEN